jgi:hypothetical protein
MSKEFSLVLLGAGLLSAGYFFWPEDGLAAQADEHGAKQMAGTRASHYHGMHFYPLFLSSGRAGPGIGSGATAGISRGGFGSIGRGVSGVS